MRTLRRRRTGRSSYRRSGPQIRGPGLPARRGRSGCAGEPVFQLPPRPAGDDSQPHRRPGGSGPASGEPLHGAAPSSFGCAYADRHPEGGTALQPSSSGGPEAVGAVSGDAASLSQGPGEQRLLQLLVSQQLAQGAPHPSIGGGDGGQAGVGCQGRPLRRPQQQAGPRCGGGGGRCFFSRSRRRGDHCGCDPPRSRQRAAGRRRLTAGRQLERQEEEGRRWRRWRTAGVPYAEPRGAG